jgi:hypothetical protein
MVIKFYIRVILVLIVLSIIISIFSCEGNPYEVNINNENTRLPIYYALIGPENDVKVYYENTRRMGEKLDFRFKKIENGSLFSLNNEFKLNNLKEDDSRRLFNTVETSNFTARDTVFFNHNDSKSKCIIPQPFTHSFKIDTVIEEGSRYKFVMNQKISSNIVNFKALSWKVELIYNGTKLQSFLEFPSLKRRLGIENTFFNNYILQEDFNIFFENSYIYLNKSNEITPTKPLNLPSGLKFDKDLIIYITIHSLDENIVNHIQAQGKNASGIENPLNLYAPTYQNISNALGFMGCFNTFTYKIER